MTMIIRSLNGDIREEEISTDIQFSPSQGEQIYFTGIKSYTFELVDDNKGMNLSFQTNEEEQITIVLSNLANLIEQNNPLDPFSEDTIFGVSTNEEGDRLIDDTLHNPKFESDEIIETLKEVLSLDGTTIGKGAVIDNFQSLLESMKAPSDFTKLIDDNDFDLNDITSIDELSLDNKKYDTFNIDFSDIIILKDIDNNFSIKTSLDTMVSDDINFKVINDGKEDYCKGYTSFSDNITSVLIEINTDITGLN